MPKTKYKIIVNALLILGLSMPAFIMAQEDASQAPETIEEAKSLGLKILGGLPEAIKDVWQNQALPLWIGMWDRARPYLEPWWQKFLGLWEKKKPDLEEEFQKEKQEMKEDLPKTIETSKSLWEKFKDLWK